MGRVRCVSSSFEPQPILQSRHWPSQLAQQHSATSLATSVPVSGNFAVRNAVACLSVREELCCVSVQSVQSQGTQDSRSICLCVSGRDDQCSGHCGESRCVVVVVLRPCALLDRNTAPETGQGLRTLVTNLLEALPQCNILLHYVETSCY